MSNIAGNPFISVPLDNSNSTINQSTGDGASVGPAVVFESLSGDRQRIYTPARFEAGTYQIWYQVYRNGAWQTYATVNSGIVAGS